MFEPLPDTSWTARGEPSSSDATTCTTSSDFIANVHTLTTNVVYRYHPIPSNIYTCHSCKVMDPVPWPNGICMLTYSHKHTHQSSYECPTKVPNIQIRFRWTLCRGTMHQTLITDRGRPKNRYPYKTSVYGFLVQNQSVLALSLQSYSRLACLQLIATFQFLTYSRYYPPIPKPIPTDTQKPWQICLESPVGQNSFGLHHENPYLQPFFRQHQMDQVYVCLVSFSMHFIHIVCLAVSLFLFLAI